MLLISIMYYYLSYTVSYIISHHVMLLCYAMTCNNAILHYDMVCFLGFVNYTIKGAKPGVFRRAPSFLLDGTIDFIQKRVADFVNKKFSVKIMTAFRQYKRKAVVLNDESGQFVETQ